jgi:hypothetical protein
MDFDDIRIEKLRQKILRFNGLMEELSSELTIIVLEGNKKKFQDVILEMMVSLDKAQDTVKRVHSLVLGKEKTN